MKNLANAISLTRPFLALSLFFFINNKSLFLVMYCLCWFTDLIDGPIARATKSVSDFGSRLDDIGDYTIIVVAIIIFSIWLQAAFLPFVPLIGIMLVIRVSNGIITKRKYGKVFIIHTYLNKFTAFTVFLMPVIYILTGTYGFLYFVLAVSIIASFEETIIHLKSDVYSSERKSIFKNSI